MRKKTLHFTFEIKNGVSFLEVMDPTTNEVVARELGPSIHNILTHMDNGALEEIIIAAVGDEDGNK